MRSFSFILILFLLFCSFSPVISQQFIEIGYIDKGMWFESVNGYDTNHNGSNEIIFTWSDISFYGAKFYEYQDSSGNYLNVFDIEDCSPDAVGNIDNDSLTDLVTKDYSSGTPYLSIFESPGYNSFPSLLVWSIPLPSTVNYGAKITDMDCDGNKDIILHTSHSYFIFENSGDNIYDLVYSDSFSFWIADFSVGDFDCDGKMEIESGEMYGYQYIIENAVVGEDTFELTWGDSIPDVTSLYTHASAQDMDQDGKPEFVVAGNILSTWDRLVTIYETIGNNSYERVWTRIFPNAAASMRPSIIVCGDVDDDGIDEMVIAVTDFGVYIFEAVGNDNYQQIWFYPINSLDITGLLIYDLNKNGINEFAIATEDDIRIFEYIPPGVEEEQDITQIHPEIAIFPNPFRESVNIKQSITKKTNGRKVKIIDVSGRIVKEFLLHTEIIWNGKDKQGRNVASGVYFLSIGDAKSGEVIWNKILKVE